MFMKAQGPAPASKHLLGVRTAEVKSSHRVASGIQFRLTKEENTSRADSPTTVLHKR